MATTFPQTILIIIVAIIIICCMVKVLIRAVRCLIPAIITIIGIVAILFLIGFLIQLASQPK
jgi:hypothetical protein